MERILFAKYLPNRYFAYFEPLIGKKDGMYILDESPNEIIQTILSIKTRPSGKSILEFPVEYIPKIPQLIGRSEFKSHQIRHFEGVQKIYLESVLDEIIPFEISEIKRRSISDEQTSTIPFIKPRGRINPRNSL